MSTTKDSFSFKRGARLPARIVQLAGNGLTSLDGISGATFVYRKIGISERKTIAANVHDSAAMQVSVAFGAIDVATEGKYQWQIEVDIGGLVMSFPEKGFYTFSITDNIEP